MPFDFRKLYVTNMNCQFRLIKSRNQDIFQFFSVSDAYTKESLVYEWQGNEAVSIVSGMTLSQFDLMSISQNNYTYKRREGEFAVVQVSFNLQRHTGYFLIQVIESCDFA